MAEVTDPREARWRSAAAFLADPATRGGAQTQRIDTHTAVADMAMAILGG